jgi:hypothetical protein
MSKLKPFYPSEDKVPADLKGAYAKDANSDRYILIELDDDVPIVQTKLSLETTQTTLKEEVRKANEKITRLETTQLPAGKIAVDPEIETLGNAAKAAELKAEDIPALKTKADDLQKQIDQTNYEKTIQEVATANELNDKFVELAKDKNLKFEKKTEKDEEKNDVDVWYVTQEKDGNKETIALDKFFENDPFFSKFADTFASSDEGNGNGEGNGSGKKWVKQESGKGGKAVPGAQKTIDSRYGNTVKDLTKTTAE